MDFICNFRVERHAARPSRPSPDRRDAGAVVARWARRLRNWRPELTELGSASSIAPRSLCSSASHSSAGLS